MQHYYNLLGESISKSASELSLQLGDRSCGELFIEWLDVGPCDVVMVISALLAASLEMLVSISWPAGAALGAGSG